MVEEPSHVKQLSLNHVCKIGLTILSNFATCLALVACNLTVVGILGLIVWCSWDYAGRYLKTFLSFI